MVAKTAKRLEISVPEARSDKLPLTRVGVIAAVGFVCGVIWPWLAGVKLVPDAPEEGGPSIAAESPSAEPESVKSPAAAKVAPAEEPAAPEERVQLSPAIYLGCVDKSGKKLKRCDEIDFDSVAKARMQALTGCEGAQTASGTLSIGFNLSFAKKQVTKVMRGKSTTLPDDVAAVLLTCAEKEFKSASLDGIEHEHVSYTLFYKAEFFPPGTAPGKRDDAGPPVTEAHGVATVAWNVAMIRDKPSKDGEIVARVLSGTRITVTGRQDDWYRVKYDTKGGEGWVHKGAIGL